VRAVCLEAPGHVQLVEVPDPEPGPGEVLVRVRACGICGSDLNAWRGVPGISYPLPPGAPGHEVWGEVARGDGARVLDGQLVTGLVSHGLAELSTAPVDQLLPLPETIGSPFLGEPLACAANIARRAAIQADQRVAVVGFGYLAALVVQIWPVQPSAWVAISRRPDSLALARHLGAEATATFDRVPAAWWDSFPVVIEAAGVQHALDVATWLVAYGGRLVIAGYHADGPRTISLQTWNWKGIDVINAHERDPRVVLQGLQQGLAQVQRRGLALEQLISHRWPLDQLDRAFAAAEARPPGYIKGIIEP